MAKRMYATRAIDFGLVVSGKLEVRRFEEGDELKGMSDKDIAALGSAATEASPRRAAPGVDEEAEAKARAEAEAKARAEAEAAALKQQQQQQK